MNNCALVGRLTKDPEMRYTANNIPVCGFNLAVNRRFKQEGQPEADFISVVAWQKTAEFCSKYFKKGQQIWLNGRLQTRNWEDSEGKKHYVTEVVAEEVGFADSKKEEGQAAPAAPAAPAAQQQQRQQQQQVSKPAANKMPWEQ